MRFFNKTLLTQISIITFISLTFLNTLSIPNYSDYDSRTLILNPNITYQNIDGLGGFGAKRFAWEGDNNFAFTDQSWMDKMTDLGVSMQRSSIPPDFEKINDNQDSYSLDLDTIEQSALDPNSLREDNFYKQLPYWKDLASKDIRMIFSVWSPPEWMKIEGNLNGGTIIDNQQNFDEFAERLVAFVKLIKKHTGTEPFAISIQNEPVFSLGYASTKIDPIVYSKLTGVVGQRFQNENINVKLFGPENPPGDGTIKWVDDYIAQMDRDDTLKYLYSVTYHGYYSDGVRSMSPQQKDFWTDFKTLKLKHDIKIWNTETDEGGADRSWDKAFSLAKDMNFMFNYGDVSAFTFWQISNQFFVDDNNDNFTPTKVYYSAKQFYKYIRPRFERIDLQGDNVEIIHTAFINPETKRTVVTLLNTTNQSKNVKLSTLPNAQVSTNYEYIITDSDSNNADLKYNVNLDQNIEIPANAIVTLNGI
jgi:glucuronoarabinoxylan endo-1,4-beta-xylanase